MVRIIIVHAENKSDIYKQGVTQLKECFKHFPCIAFPSEAPLGGNIHTDFCAYVKDDCFVVLLVTKAFETCPFCTFATQQAILKTKRIVPVLCDGTSPPEIITTYTAVSFDDPEFCRKLQEAVQPSCRPEPAFHTSQVSHLADFRVLRINGEEFTQGTIHVKKYVKRAQDLRQPTHYEEHYDNIVELKYWQTDAGRENQRISGVKITAQACVEINGSNMQDTSSVVHVRLKEDSITKAFYLRFNKLQQSCVVAVTFELLLEWKTSEWRYHDCDTREETLVNSTTLQFAVQAKPKKSKRQAKYGRSSGHEADEEEDEGKEKNSKKGTAEEDLMAGLSLTSGAAQRNSKPPTRVQNNHQQNETHQWSDLEVWLYRTPKNRVIPVKLSSMFNTDVYRNTMAYLEELGDRNTNDFLEVVTELIQNPGVKPKHKVDMVVAMQIKKISVLHYRGDYAQCQAVGREIKWLLKSTKESHRLHGRFCYYLSAIDREKKHFGSSQEWIEKSHNALHQVEACDDTAKVFYNDAKLQIKILTHSPQSNAAAVSERKKLAIQSLQMAIEHFRADVNIDSKQIRRCILNIIGTKLLFPRTTLCREAEVDESCLKEGETDLETLYGKKLVINSKRQDMQILMIKCEIAFRRYCVYISKCRSYNGKKLRKDHRCVCTRKPNGHVVPKNNICVNMQRAISTINQAIVYFNGSKQIWEEHHYKAEASEEFEQYLHAIKSSNEDYTVQAAAEETTESDASSESGDNKPKRFINPGDLEGMSDTLAD